MSAPVVWIIFPIALAVGLWLARKRQRIVVAVATLACLGLALLAAVLQAGTPLRLGPLTLNLQTAMTVFGRRFVIKNNEHSFLILLYLFGGIWFMGARPAKAGDSFVPLGLAMIALMVAAQAVEPFLYAALIIEVVVLLSLPLLAPPGQKAGPGALRFLVFQTLAIPFILLAGWAAGMVEANPPGTRWTLEAILFLGLGFFLWLAVFPFYTWVPLLAQEATPYVVGFLFGLLPVAVLWIMLSFLDGYTWMRTSPLIGPGLQLAGGLMVLTAGIWAAFQTNLVRQLGYAILLQNGFALLAVGLRSAAGLQLFADTLLPRLMSVALWALALALLQKHDLPLTLEGLRGAVRRYPFACSGLAMAYFAAGGLPLLPAFPARQAIMEALVAQAPGVTTAVFLGTVGFLLGGFRLLMALVSGEIDGWQRNERLVEAVMLLVGMLLLVLTGLAPDIMNGFATGLVQAFTHLR